jgi:ribosomal protein S18 acetylase RimI-like enzyme
MPPTRRSPGAIIAEEPMSPARIDLIAASGPADYHAGRELFEEYAAQLGVDLCFQNFAAELEQLPELYGPPAGRLILAIDRHEYVGCVAVRPLARQPDACEMKRLYVRPSARGGGLGRALATAALDAGRELGYRRMLLDTLERMAAALSLYESLGFRDTSAYYDNPNGDVRYLERLL